MKLYNTLTRQLDEIKPLNAPTVTIYTCGPTVYDYAHIGHWYNYVRMDTLVRALRLAGFKTKWVMNITDVGHLVSDADDGEDKLEKGARREGKTAWEVAEYYTRDFLECMELLGITKPDHIVKATDHIVEQIELIQQLEKKGFTYVIDDGVYYDTAKFEGYASFARLDLDEQQAGARVAYNEQKRNPTDFALWKFSPKGSKRDMEWDSPWAPPGETKRKGFPGWHIECSAMSMKYLGESLDIHTGGIDHIPVHHTNEIAQSEAATGKRFAQYWMHSNHVMVNGEKISKSLGNGIRLQDILKKGIPTEAVRLAILESHYRSQSQFSWDSLEAAKNRLDDIRAWADMSWQSHTDVMPKELDEAFRDLKVDIVDTLSNDLNTPAVLALISKFMSKLAEFPLPRLDGLYSNGTLNLVDDALGLNIGHRPDITTTQKQLIIDREKAREAKNWAKSDELRDKLKADGLNVRDTQFGSVWSRINA